MPYISDFEWGEGNTVTVREIDHHPKKITGSKFAAVLGRDKFQTPFGAWCELTRVAARPFAVTPSTRAGEAIEPKVCEYVGNLSKYRLITPADIWGNDFKNATGYDFYSEDPVFGGMWDAMLLNDAGKGVGMIEIKTTREKNRIFWEDDKMPEAYELQVQLYTALSGLSYYHVAASFLTDNYVQDPGGFECDGTNTIVLHRKISPEFPSLMEEARKWYSDYIHDYATSPPYDEEKDAEYLDILRERSSMR